MKKLFKVSKELKTDVSNPSGPADPYWSDVIAVFNMEDTLNGYTGISNITPTIIKRHSSLGFINGWNGQGRMFQTTNAYGAKLSLPISPSITDFTLEGYGFINTTQAGKYFITIGSNTGQIIKLNTTISSGLALYYPGGFSNAYNNPSWPFGTYFTYAVVMKDLTLASYVNGRLNSYSVLNSKPMIDFSTLYLGCYDFNSTTYNIASCFGPIRLTRKARYINEYISDTSHFTYPTHG